MRVHARLFLSHCSMAEIVVSLLFDWSVNLKQILLIFVTNLIHCVFLVYSYSLEGKIKNLVSKFNLGFNLVLFSSTHPHHSSSRFQGTHTITLKLGVIMQ